MPVLTPQQIETADALLKAEGFTPITASYRPERYYERYYMPQEGMTLLRLSFTGEFELTHRLQGQELQFKSQSNPDNPQTHL